MNVATLRALQLDALPIFRLHRLFVAPMACNAPIYRYSLRCRICFHRLHGYFKPCRSSICAPLFNTVLFAPYSAPFRVCRYPFRVSSVYLPRCVRRCRFPRIVPRSAFACPIVKEQRKPKFAMMEINANKSAPRQPHPRFYWRFRISTDFLREANSPKSAVWRGVV